RRRSYSLDFAQRHRPLAGLSKDCPSCDITSAPAGFKCCTAGELLRRAKLSANDYASCPCPTRRPRSLGIFCLAPSRHFCRRASTWIRAGMGAGGLGNLLRCWLPVVISVYRDGRRELFLPSYISFNGATESCH